MPIKIKAKAKNIKIACRGSGLEKANQGFAELCESFDGFKAAYDELDQEGKAELEAAIGEDLCGALAEGSKNQFESEIQTHEDLSGSWDKLQAILELE